MASHVTGNPTVCSNVCLRQPGNIKALYISHFMRGTTRASSQYPKIRLIVRSREVSKPRDFYLELFDSSEIWQALRQHCFRCACQISKRFDNLKYQSRGFETSRDLTIRRLFGYWDGAQWSMNSLYKGSVMLSFDVFFPWRHQSLTFLFLWQISAGVLFLSMLQLSISNLGL